MSRPTPDPLFHVVGQALDRFVKDGTPKDQLRLYVSEAVWDWLDSPEGRHRILQHFTMKEANG